MCHGKCDALNLASLEQVGRRITGDPPAARRNPRHPQFGAMETVATSFLDEIGEARASTYGEWLTEQQKTEAKRLEAVRRFREEHTADRRRRADDDSPALRKPCMPALEKKGNDTDVAEP